jgi:ubiquinone/menaquinone biosynthesis C-methylase UbiE
MNTPVEKQQASSGVAAQREFFEKNFDQGMERWKFHDTTNPVVRYVRDRRLNLVISILSKQLGGDLSDFSALSICGGVGGEASFLRRAGFGTVTNSDFSENALEVCRRRDPELETLCLNAEAIDQDDNSHDVVIVQDGLHHLPRPVLGFNEMLRVAKRAVVVLEPHAGLAGRFLGREWEEHEGVFNYVFRWDRKLLAQATRSQVLKRSCTILSHQIWDHSGCVHKIVRPLGNGKWSLLAVKAIYTSLKPFNFFGNQFIGIVIKHHDARP